ncbi:uncharacterized protein LOC126968281 [Leptidea sinapis]|uniref:uncharacterized protein LOC126968281 n=1 Tax=Leptidea sinapis TaxID=189913 RepID=UPI002141DF3D|nr:uncharacterized protein LOC126968281 [Leptidea sinapis]
MDLNMSVEPMDIDVSANSVCPMDLSFNEQCSMVKEEKTDEDFVKNLLSESILTEVKKPTYGSYTPVSELKLLKTTDINLKKSKRFTVIPIMNSFDEQCSMVKEGKTDEDSVKNFISESILTEVKKPMMNHTPVSELKLLKTTGNNLKKSKRFTVKPKMKPSNVMSYIYIILPIILILTSYTYHVGIVKICSEKLDTVQIANLFSKRLYGQPTASTKIIEALEDTSKRKLLVFLGGTGVGKTLTVSLILNEISNFANVYHYTMPTFLEVYSSNFLFGLTFCKSTVLVIDDLEEKDIDLIQRSLYELLNKTENFSKNISIILVFNCNNTGHSRMNASKCDNSISKLKFIYKDFKDLKSYYVKFDNLKENSLRKCIEFELGGENKINDRELNNIMKYFDVSVDGCKGVHNKMKYYKK